jgi:hypothetical protein
MISARVSLSSHFVGSCAAAFVGQAEEAEAVVGDGLPAHVGADDARLRAGGLEQRGQAHAFLLELALRRSRASTAS